MRTNIKDEPSSQFSSLVQKVEDFLTGYSSIEYIEPALSYIHSYPNDFLRDFFPEVVDLPASLLIQSSNDETLVSLHFREDIYLKLIQLTSIDQLVSSTDGLNAIFILIEEISHFHHYVFNASTDCPLSKFDLELQAELDKIIVGSLLFQDQLGNPCTPAIIHELIQLQFDHALIEGTLTDYKHASKLAERFWKSNLEVFGHRILQDHNFRRLIQKASRRNGREKLDLLSQTLRRAV